MMTKEKYEMKKISTTMLRAKELLESMATVLSEAKVKDAEYWQEQTEAINEEIDGTMERINESVEE